MLRRMAEDKNKLRIVMDSAGDLPESWAKRFDINIIPINIHFGEKTFFQGVDLSNDLKHAKVFYSLIGDKKEFERIQEGLDSAKGFIKRELATRMELKYMPDITFRRDLSLEEGNRMERLFESLKSDEPGDSLA